MNVSKIRTHLQMENIPIIPSNLEGKRIKEEEITLNHCFQIGILLASIHTLDKVKMNKICQKKNYSVNDDWENYGKNTLLKKKKYFSLLKINQEKYTSVIKRIIKRFEESSTQISVCHNEITPRTIYWKEEKPFLVKVNTLCFDNPNCEVIETALAWSGFENNNFNKNKFKALIKGYQTQIKIKEIDWYFVICGNLIKRFSRLNEYLEQEMNECYSSTKENEIIQVIEEIERYLHLIGTMYQIIKEEIVQEKISYDPYIKKVISIHSLLKDQEYHLLPSGFTNTIYSTDNYIVRICHKKENEKRFEKEIEFYKKYHHFLGIPKLYHFDITKKLIPFHYEIIEKIAGKTLYQIWYYLNYHQRKGIIQKIVNILKPIHSESVECINYLEILQKRLYCIKEKFDSQYFLFEILLEKSSQYFKENKLGLVHGDLHFDNILINQEEVYIIDFEYCQTAPIDYEFKIFYQLQTQPWLWANEETDMLTVEKDYKDLMVMLKACYPEIRKIKYLEQRLIFYHLLDDLEKVKVDKTNRLPLDIVNRIKSL